MSFGFCVICVICGWLLEPETGDPKLETRNSKLYSDWRGAVAQLAERRVRNAEARSSTLLCSTNNVVTDLRPPSLAAVLVSGQIPAHFLPA